MQDTLDEATLLGNFTYDQEGESAQTFTIPVSPPREVTKG
jgi:hypothetical protein